MEFKEIWNSKWVIAVWKVVGAGLREPPAQPVPSALQGEDGHADCGVLGTRTCPAALRPLWSLLGFPTVHTSRAVASTLGAARLQQRLTDYTQDIAFQRLVIWLNQARFSKVYQMACCWPVWQNLNNLSFFLFKETTLFIVFYNFSLGNGWTLQHEYLGAYSKKNS